MASRLCRRAARAGLAILLFLLPARAPGGDVTPAGEADARRADALASPFGFRPSAGGREVPGPAGRSGEREPCATLPDDASCDDGDPCTADDRCLGGRCAGRPGCDDRNPCTSDRCTQTGCVHEAVPGIACWNLAGTAVARSVGVGAVQGRTFECRAACRETLATTVAIHPDGRYRSPNDLLRCTTGDLLLVPDEVGHLRPGPGGRLFARPANRAEIRAAVRSCTGFRLGRTRAWLRIAADGRSLFGREVSRRRTGGRPPVRGIVKTRFNGVLAGSGPARPPRGGPGRRLPPCAAGRRARCTER